MDETTKELRRKAASAKPSVQIGKNGVSREMTEEIKKQLKKHGLIKVKILKSALAETDRKTLAEEMANNTGARLVSLVGNTAVLYRSKTAKII
ncbi:RNA-binding protein [Candidatus Woesearchaeota archaeon]|nr:RNA-binding protein [Candidatus Woesearchaeota archaeon]